MTPRVFLIAKKHAAHETTKQDHHFCSHIKTCYHHRRQRRWLHRGGERRRMSLLRTPWRRRRSRRCCCLRFPSPYCPCPPSDAPPGKMNCQHSRPYCRQPCLLRLCLQAARARSACTLVFFCLDVFCPRQELDGRTALSGVGLRAPDKPDTPVPA